MRQHNVWCIFKFSDFNKERTSSLKMIWIMIEICWSVFKCFNINIFSLLSKKLKIKIYGTIILPVVLYGCETWSLTLREERRLRMFENRVLRRVFEPKRDELTGEWRKLHNEELSDMYSLPNIVRVVKSRRMKRAGHVARMGRGEGCTGFWWGNLRERDHWGGPDADGRIILRWIFRKLGEVVTTGWSWLRIGTGGGHLWVRWWTFGFQKCGKFLD